MNKTPELPKAELPVTITISGPTGRGKTVVAFAIQTMMRERFKHAIPVEGDTSGQKFDNPHGWATAMAPQSAEALTLTPEDRDALISVKFDNYDPERDVLLDSMAAALGVIWNNYQLSRVDADAVDTALAAYTAYKKGM